MKRFLVLFLTLSILLSLGGCAQPQADGGESVPPSETEAASMDLSGQYPLDESRNEAIIQNVAATEIPDGNANVFYQIFVGSFSDSNGDGIGDLRGIINRMDYLNDGDNSSGLSLGVEGLWLTPIFDSYSYHKYDTNDYYKIDPDFGTEEDLKELIALCHERGVKIILDLVINHTSTSHPWFKEFVSAHQAGNTESEYYEFYSWSAAPGAGKTYQTIPGTSEYYECNFSSAMPELNYDNEAVKEAVLEVAEYYLNLGVDGFRFDAAKYVYYGEENRNADFWQWFMAELRSMKSDIYTVAEVWASDGITIPYTAATNCFNFSMSQSGGIIAQAAKGGDVNTFVNYVSSYIDQVKAQNPDAMMVSFIANHDTDRAAGFLTVASGQAKIAANLSVLLPGSTFIYYGEEIGLKGSRGGASTDANRRLAMAWGDSDTVSDPEGADYTSGQTNGTVVEHLADGNSLYNHYKQLIAIRKAYPEIAYGTFTPVNTDTKLAGFASTYQGSTVVVLHNTTQNPITIDLSNLDGVSASEIAVYIGVGGATLEGSSLTLDGQTSVILK